MSCFARVSDTLKLVQELGETRSQSGSHFTPYLRSHQGENYIFCFCCLFVVVVLGFGVLMFLFCFFSASVPKGVERKHTFTFAPEEIYLDV